MRDDARTPRQLGAQLGQQAVQQLKTLLEDNAPYQAKVTFQGGGATGWNAPASTPWFDKALDGAALSIRRFGATPLIELNGTSAGAGVAGRGAACDAAASGSGANV